MLVSMTCPLLAARSYSSAPRKPRPLMALAIIDVVLDAKEEQSQALRLRQQLL
jgi:hypothetical protein